MRIGETIEISYVRYEIGKRVGEGAFGQIFKARNLINQKEVAIKIQREMSKEEENFMQTMKGKNFRNLINVYDFTRDYKNNYLIVMEYCVESLFDLIQKKKIHPNDIRFIMKEIANGIKELHDLQLAHRDIKPENILISKILDSGGKSQEIYKLSGFGTTKEVDVMKIAKVGTPYYLAPEQIFNNPSGQRDSKKVDIWAFGAVIYEILTGNPMFNGYNEEQVWNNIKNSKQEDINKIIDNDMKIERKYRTLIHNMLLIDSSKRYSIEQVMKDLRADSVIVTREQPFNLIKKEIPTSSLPNPINNLLPPNSLKQQQKEISQDRCQNMNQNQQKQGIVQVQQEIQRQFMPIQMKPFQSPQQKMQGFNSLNNNQQNQQICNQQTFNNPTNLSIQNQFSGKVSKLGQQFLDKSEDLKNQEKKIFNCNHSTNLSSEKQKQPFYNGFQNNQPFQQFSYQNQNNFKYNQSPEQNNKNQFNYRMGLYQENQVVKNENNTNQTNNQVNNQFSNQNQFSFRMPNFQPLQQKQESSSQNNQTQNPGYFINNKAMEGFSASKQIIEQKNQQNNQINKQFNVVRGRQ